MVNRIYLSAAIAISAISLTVTAIISPGAENSDPPVSTPNPTSIVSPTLEDSCLAVDQIMYQSLGPVLETLQDTPESRQNAASILRTQAPSFKQISDHLPDEESSIVFAEFTDAALELADALDSDASPESVESQFEVFNTAGAQMSNLCFESFDENATP